MAEALQQTTEQAPDTLVEIPLDRKKEIYNALTLTIGGVQGLARNIDRLAVGDSRHLADIDRPEEEPDKDVPVSGTLRGYYGHIVDAATVVPDAECEKLWGVITEGRLTSTLSNLARGYRYIKARGVLTEYTRPESGATADYYGESKTAPPLEIIRRPIVMSEADAEQLLDAPEEEKIVFLSEMLDPYRFRHDQDTSAAEISAQETEKAQIIGLLESLQPSWERDLLATEAWKYFRHPDIDGPELAGRSIGLISVPELERAVRDTDEHLSEHAPDVIVARFRDSSAQALQDVERKLHLTKDTKTKIETEVAETAGDIAVTINIPLTQLTRALFDSHRLLPINETKSSGGSDINSDEFRRQMEAGYAIYDENAGDVLSRPVYAAVARGEDERLHGPIGARGYGDCVITLRPGVAQERTTYTYGDSGNTYSRHPNIGNAASTEPRPAHSLRVMTYDEVPEAKAVFDNYDPNPRRLTSDSVFDPPDLYIEAQVLGGVEIDDIESITLPARRAYQDPKLLSRIKELYPSLNVKVLVSREVAERNQEKIEKTTEELGIDFVIADE